MAAPSVGTVTATTTGSTTAVTGTVPAGVVANSVVIVVVNTGSATITGLGTTGLVHAPGSPLLSQPAGNSNINILWKRSTGSEPGSYALTQSAAQFWASGAARIDNAVTSGSPWDANSGTGTALNNSNAANSLTTSMTTGGADELLFNVAGQFNGTVWTQPTSFTKDFTDSAAPGIIYFAHLAQAVAGATGTLTTSVSGAVSQMADWLGALLPVGGSTNNGTTPSVVGAVRPPRTGSTLVLGSRSPSTDHQPPAAFVGTPTSPPRPPGSALILGSTAPSPDFQQPPDVFGAPLRPKLAGSALLFGSRADPVVATDTPSPAVVVGAVRPPRPAGSATVQASQAPSPDFQQPPDVVTAGRYPATTGSAAVLSSRADPVIPTDSQPRVLVAAPLRPTGPGSTLVVSSTSPSADAQPAPLVVLAGLRPPRTGGVVLSRVVTSPPAPPTLAPVTVGSFTIPRRRPAGIALLTRMTSDFAVCTTPRPFTGTTGRPGSGTTAYNTATTARPGSGTTTRPDTGSTTDPC